MARSHLVLGNDHDAKLRLAYNAQAQLGNEKSNGGTGFYPLLAQAEICGYPKGFSWFMGEPQAHVQYLGNRNKI